MNVELEKLKIENRNAKMTARGKDNHNIIKKLLRRYRRITRKDT